MADFPPAFPQDIPGAVAGVPGAAGPEVAQLTALVHALQLQLQQLQNRSQGPPQLKAPKPNTYKGERDVLQWVFRTERYFGSMGVTDEMEQVQFASTLLDGVAANWLRCVLAEPGATLPASWVSFKSALIKQFQPLADEEDARQKLMRITQRKSVRQYVQLFMDTALRLPDMHVKDKIFRFKEGLTLQCREWVTRARPITLLDAMEAAEEWEQIHLGERSRDSTAKFRARQSKPEAEAEPMQLGSSSMKTNKKTTSSSNAEVKTERPNTVRKCFKCGKPGHIARDCRGGKPRVNNTEVEDEEDSATEDEPSEEEN
jgi:Retrotransposon gag protein/Zinc knuckle